MKSIWEYSIIDALDAVPLLPMLIGIAGGIIIAKILEKWFNL